MNKNKDNSTLKKVRIEKKLFSKLRLKLIEIENDEYNAGEDLRRKASLLFFISH
jgi:hypothetical protein